ncbi:MAG: TldD/PmbA family protein [Planctomycetota bacterium]|nr:TldD/PmbA family protein [Planctomycetota bacterium]
MKDLALHCIDTANSLGASYSDIRIIEQTDEDIATYNGAVGNIGLRKSLGYGIRVICNGAWGFASNNVMTPEGIEKTTARAVAIAKASATTLKEPVKLAGKEVHVDTWRTPVLIDPFDVPVDQKFDLLFAIDHELRKDTRIRMASASMGFTREHQWLMTSEGSWIDQLLYRGGAGYQAMAVDDSGERQVRSYPSSHRGQNMTMGYELVESLPLLEEAPRIREEAVQLLSADPCPSGKADIILDPTQLCLQIHESVGHATELDRVLGMEANFAGTSFCTTEKKGNFRYGSDIVNLVADSTVPNGLATIGYDDDGVPAQRWHIVRNGIFENYLTNRELAHVVNDDRSRGCNRAMGYQNVPIVRITNLSLMPGEWDFDDLVADTGDGIYMMNNRSWSIDQRRLNFQFGCELAYEIKDGNLGRMLKNPTYQGITPKFWGSCDAICGQDHWQLWGVPNCGKGQPMQTAEMSHGSAPARFRNITVGVGS